MTTPLSLRTDTLPDAPYGPEHDACALILSVRKHGEGTYGTSKRALGALSHMGHRTGFVDGEGDGAGVQTDIPRQIWARNLSRSGLRSSLAVDPRFWVGHCFIPYDVDHTEVSNEMSRHLNAAGLNPLTQQPGKVHLAGELVRQPDLLNSVDVLHLRFTPSSVGGNGFAAFTTEKMDVVIEGGAQDGTAKSMSAGRVAVMKGLNHNGVRLDGNVGKSFAYGAQGGLIIVQGNADTRACIRLSGADVILGGEITEYIDDSLGVSGTRANLKGYACEYMTSGRVLIMGDPGPYAFAGMTGGVVYQHLTPELGFDLDALQRRFAKGATVMSATIEVEDTPQIQELLSHYVDALEHTDQYEAAERIRALMPDQVLKRRFVKVVANL